MTALRATELIVVVQPSDHAAETECRRRRIQLVACSWHARAQWHDSAWDHGPNVLGAVGEIQSVQRTRQRIGHAQARDIHYARTFDLVVFDVVCDIYQYLIRGRAQI